MFDMQPELSGETLCLRPLTEADRAAMTAASSDPLIWELHPAVDRHLSEKFQPYFDKLLASGGTLVVIDRASGDMIGWSMTNTTKLVAPLWGAERMLGTNPISIAFPGLKNLPIVIDLATSAAAYGKIEIAKRKGAPVPKGWIINNQGEMTTDPNDMINGGALLPLGSERELGGHKGYALSAMVDILTSVLSGANWGPFAPPFALRQEIPSRSVGKGIGHFFGAMQIDGFMEVDEFKKRIDEWIEVFRNTKPAKGTTGVMIPGDPEHTEEAIRRKNGVPLIDAVINDLKDISKQTGIPF